MRQQNDTINVSVIIAAYNEEKNIEKCIESIVSQKYSSLEIIVVDDGSTDKTEALLQLLSKKYRVLSYYKQKNQGVSVARNTGLNYAKGKYIMFMDADDELLPECIERMVSEIQMDDVSLVQGLQRYRTDKSDILLDYNRKTIVCSKELMSISLNRSRRDVLTDDIRNSTHGCYGKLFKKSIITESQLMFVPGLGLGEDLLFYIEYLKNSDNIKILEYPVYVITINERSSTRRYNPKMASFAENAIERIWAFVECKDFYYLDVCKSVVLHLEVCVQSDFANVDCPNSLFVTALDFDKWIHSGKIRGIVVEAARYILEQKQYDSVKDKMYLYLLRNEKYKTFIVLKKVYSKIRAILR